MGPVDGEETQGLMPTIVDTSGLDRLRARFDRLVNPNPAPLLLRIENLIDDGNRKGVLAGLDKDGENMAPVTYRPAHPGTKSVKLTVEQRLGQKPAHQARQVFADRLGSRAHQ